MNWGTFTITDSAGTVRWYVDGKLHREDGPAIEYTNGDESWYLNDNLHRSDGPAVKYSKYRAWHLHGQFIKGLAVFVK